MKFYVSRTSQYHQDAQPFPGTVREVVTLPVIPAKGQPGATFDRVVWSVEIGSLEELMEWGDGDLVLSRESYGPTLEIYDDYRE